MKMFVRVEPETKTFESFEDYTMEDLKFLDDYENRKENFLKYTVLDFPKWKRLEFSEFKKVPIEKYDGEFFDGDASVLVKSVEGLKDRRFADLLSKEFNGIHPKFTLMASTFFNTGFSALISKSGKIKATYDLDKNNVIIENSAVKLEANTDATIIRSIHGHGTMSVSASKFILEPGSKLKIFNVMIAPKTPLSTSSTVYFLDDDSELEVYDVIFGGQKTAIDQTVNLNGRGAKATLKAVYLSRGKERIDLRYALNHFAPGTYGRIFANGVLMDEAYSVFRGNIEIKKEASNSDSEEKSFVLNLSKKSRADSIPGLFVDNSTVTAKHGASVGNIDEDKLYYLMSRGLDERSAIKLIVSGFFNPFIEKISQDNVELKGEIEDALSIRI
jgi:Fe-S cluster assembly protein SufD